MGSILNVKIVKNESLELTLSTVEFLKICNHISKYEVENFPQHKPCFEGRGEDYGEQGTKFNNPRSLRHSVCFDGSQMRCRACRNAKVCKKKS